MKAATPADVADAAVLCISIHAAREGGDYNEFITIRRGKVISIHAAREGGDLSPVQHPIR